MPACSQDVACLFGNLAFRFDKASREKGRNLRHQKEIVALLRAVTSCLKNQSLDIRMESQIHIVGPLMLQNELLCELLEQKTGLPCATCHEDDLTSLVDEHKKVGGAWLILRDSLGTDMTKLWTELSAWRKGNMEHCSVALFNVIPDLEVCKEALRRGVRGIFFENDHLLQLAKGVRAILDGKLWFSRDTVAECFLEKPRLIRPLDKSPASLSPREEEILMMIAYGATNHKISDELCISPNTVKTHAYNIFRKINVDNRLQAALWAVRSLEL